MAAPRRVEHVAPRQVAHLPPPEGRRLADRVAGRAGREAPDQQQHLPVHPL